MTETLQSAVDLLSRADLLRLIAAIVVVLVVLWVVWRNRHRDPPFRVRPRPLMTDNEIEFHERLCTALPEYQVLAQVSMGALIEPDVSGGSGHWLSIRSRFAQKVVDFVVIDVDRQVVALIELDDATHDRRRDAERDAITELAGYTTLRYESRDKPDIDTLRDDLALCRPVRLPRR